MKKSFSWFERFLILNIALILIFFPYIGYLPWWPVNIYIPILLLWYAFIKKNLSIWIGVNYVVSSILLYYPIKIKIIQLYDDSTYLIFLVLSTFGLALIFSSIYLNSIKEVKVLKVLRLTLMIWSICFIPNCLTNFICWAIFVMGR